MAGKGNPLIFFHTQSNKKSVFGTYFISMKYLRGIQGDI